MNTNGLNDALDSALGQLEQDYRRNLERPVLESDIVGYILRYLLDKRVVTPPEIHIMTRVIGLGNEKVDLAVGPVVLASGRPERRVIDATLALEVKFICADKTPGEKSKTSGRIDVDIAKLARLKRRSRRTACAVLCVDECARLSPADVQGWSQRAAKKDIGFRYLRLRGTESSGMPEAGVERTRMTRATREETVHSRPSRGHAGRISVPCFGKMIRDFTAQRGKYEAKAFKDYVESRNILQAADRVNMRTRNYPSWKQRVDRAKQQMLDRGELRDNQDGTFSLTR